MVRTTTTPPLRLLLLPKTSSCLQASTLPSDESTTEGDNDDDATVTAASSSTLSSSSSSQQQSSRGVLQRVKGYFNSRKKKDDNDGLTFRQQLAKMGLAAALSYGWVSNMSYSVTVSLAWYIHSKQVRACVHFFQVEGGGLCVKNGLVPLSLSFHHRQTLTRWLLLLWWWLSLSLSLFLFCNDRGSPHFFYSSFLDGSVSIGTRTMEKFFGRLCRLLGIQQCGPSDPFGRSGRH